MSSTAGNSNNINSYQRQPVEAIIDAPAIGIVRNIPGIQNHISPTAAPEDSLTRFADLPKEYQEKLIGSSNLIKEEREGGLLERLSFETKIDDHTLTGLSEAERMGSIEPSKLEQALDDAGLKVPPEFKSSANNTQNQQITSTVNSKSNINYNA